MYARLLADSDPTWTDIANIVLTAITLIVTIALAIIANRLTKQLDDRARIQTSQLDDRAREDTKQQNERSRAETKAQQNIARADHLRIQKADIRRALTEVEDANDDLPSLMTDNIDFAGVTRASRHLATAIESSGGDPATVRNTAKILDAHSYWFVNRAKHRQWVERECANGSVLEAANGVMNVLLDVAKDGILEWSGTQDDGEAIPDDFWTAPHTAYLKGELSADDVHPFPAPLDFETAYKRWLPEGLPADAAERVRALIRYKVNAEGAFALILAGTFTNNLTHAEFAKKFEITVQHVYRLLRQDIEKSALDQIQVLEGQISALLSTEAPID